MKNGHSVDSFVINHIKSINWMDYRIVILVVIGVVIYYSCQSNSINKSEHIRTLAEPLIINRKFDGAYEIISDASISNRPLYVSDDPKTLFDRKPKCALAADTFRIEPKHNKDPRLFFRNITTKKLETHCIILLQKGYLNILSFLLVSLAAFRFWRTVC